MGSKGASGLEKQPPAGLRAEGEQQKLSPAKAQRAGAWATEDRRSVLLQRRSQDAHSLFKPEVFPELVDLYLQPRLVLRITVFSLLDASWLLAQATDSGWHQGLDLGGRKTVHRTSPTQPRNLERN